MGEKEDMSVLIQIAKSLEEAETKLETAYKKKDYDNFYKLKKIILGIQGKILEGIKWFQ